VYASSVLYLNDVRGLGAFRTLGHFEFHGLALV